MYVKYFVTEYFFRFSLALSNTHSFHFNKRLIVNEHMYSQFLRLITARGSNTVLVTIGPTKVKAFKSVLFTDGIPEVKIN